MEYPRRKGAKNLGGEYEILITALFALRLAFSDKIKNYWIASNVDLVGDCDDFVAIVEPTSGNTFALFVQLKHKDKPTELKSSEFTYVTEDHDKRKRDKENFSLNKYQFGYQKLCNTLKAHTEEKKTEFIQKLSQIKLEDLYLILYTNREINKSTFNFLRKLKCDDIFELINTDQNNIDTDVDYSASYSFDEKKLITYDPTFLKKVQLYVRQVHCKDTEDLITDTIKSVFKSTKFQKVNYKKIAKTFIDLITNWIESAEMSSSNVTEPVYRTLSKEEVRYFFLDIVLEPYQYTFPKKRFNSYQSERKMIWNQIILKSKVTLITNSKKPETVHLFLAEYFGNEIKKFTSLNKYPMMWNEDLSRSAQKCLFEKYPDLQISLNILCAKKEPNLRDIYKYLWFNRKLPILLTVDERTQYQDILKILRYVNFKVIIVSNTDLTLERKENYILENLGDLDNEDQNVILKLPVKFQNRTTLPLENIILEPSTMKVIKINDIVQILCNSFDIGPSCKPLPNLFIDRSIPKILLNFDILMTPTVKDMFVVEIQPNTEIDQKVANRRNVFVANSENGTSRFQELTKNKKKVHHVTALCDKYLQWKESKGDVENLKNYLIYDSKLYDRLSKDNVENFLNQCKINNVNLISACSGMGKTIILDYLAWFAPENCMSLTVSLRDIADDDTFEKPSLFLDYFKERIGKSLENAPLFYQVYDNFIKKKKLILFLDGFDEIAIMHKEKICNLIQYLRNQCTSVWITTRDHMRNYLENEFFSLACTLLPFTRDEQSFFLVDYFKSLDTNINSESFVNHFVECLLKSVNENITDREREFAGIPLQTYLLALGFSTDYLNSAKENVVAFDEIYDVVKLFEKFMVDKTKILYEKYNNSSEKLLQKMVEEEKYILAARHVLGSRLWEMYELDKEFTLQSDSKIFEAQLVQRDGIMIITCKNEKILVDFVHNTFAEFLSAKWLANNLKVKTKSVKKLKKILFEYRFVHIEQYRFLFIVFDQLMSECSVFHYNIINLNYYEICKQISENSDVLDVKDKFDRSGLHLLSIYSNEFEESQLIFILNTIENLRPEIVNATDFLNFTFLDYCFLTDTYLVAEKVFSEVKSLVNMSVYGVSIPILIINPTFYATIFHNYLIRDLLIGDITLDSTVRYFCVKLANELNFDQSVWKNVEVINNIKLVCDYLKEVKIKFDDYYTDIRFATVFGNLENIEQLLDEEDYDVNKTDAHNGTTLLAYSAMHGRSQIFDYFLQNGGDVNIPGRNGDTVLHCMAESGFDDLLKKCIKLANLDQYNDSFKTALDTALFLGNTSTAKLLISHGAKININTYTLSCIHDASEEGDNELIDILVIRGFNINDTLPNGKTCLHSALENGHVHTAHQLIKLGINVKQDNAQDNYIHLAAKLGQTELIDIFLKNDHDVNRPNILLETPLMIAILAKQEETALFLIEKNADIHIRSNSSSVFHEAIRAGMLSVLKFFVADNKCDLNTLEEKGVPLLLLALSYRQFEIVNYLIPIETLNLEIADSRGYNALHYSAYVGSIEFTKLFLSKNFDVSYQTEEKETPLHIALKQEHYQLAEMLFSPSVMFIRNCDGNLPLHLAAAAGQSKLVEPYIKEKNILLEEGRTAFILALKNGHVETARMIFYELDTECICEDIDEILQLAAKIGAEDIIKDCLNKGAQINSQDWSGKTPLHLAIMNNQFSTAKYLLSKNADPNIEDKYLNGNCLHECVSRGNCDLAFQLLEMGMDPNKVNGCNETPLILAIIHGHKDLVTLLLDHDAQIEYNSKRTLPFNILHYVAGHGFEEILRDAVQKGMDVNDKNSDGESALDYAMNYKNFTIVHLLVNELNCEVRSTHISLFYLSFDKIEDVNELKKLMEMFEIIVKKCGNVNTYDFERKTPLYDICFQNNKSQLDKTDLDRQFYENCVKMLIKHGAEYHIKNPRDDTVYKLLKREKQDVILKILENDI